MHVGAAQVAGDSGNAGTGGLQVAHLADSDDAGGPGRARHASGQEQRVLLVVFRATQPRDGREQ
jgi:hypothetical protein